MSNSQDTRHMEDNPDFPELIQLLRDNPPPLASPELKARILADFDQKADPSLLAALWPFGAVWRPAAGLIAAGVPALAFAAAHFVATVFLAPAAFSFSGAARPRACRAVAWVAFFLELLALDALDRAAPKARRGRSAAGTAAARGDEKTTREPSRGTFLRSGLLGEGTFDERKALRYVALRALLFGLELDLQERIPVRACR